MTTAKTTAFTYEILEVNGFTFTFDGNQKITADNGTFEEPEANAFSTVQIKDCPWSTPACQAACYVNNLEKFQPEIHDFYKANSRNIREALEFDEDRFEVAEAFAAWINKNAPGGFRWHVSGDIFSLEYAHFIAAVALQSPTVKHWIYTRSFNFLEPLLDVGNLTVNLSADKDNYWLARIHANKYDLRVCYLTVDGEVPADLKEGDVIFPDYALRGVGQKPFEFRNDSEWWQGLEGRNKKMVCPTDIYGKTDKIRCGPCRKCID